MQLNNNTLSKGIDSGVQSLPRSVVNDDANQWIQQRKQKALVTVKAHVGATIAADAIMNALKEATGQQLDKADLSTMADLTSIINALHNVGPINNPTVSSNKQAAQQKTASNIISGLGEGVGEKSANSSSAFNTSAGGSGTNEPDYNPYSTDALDANGNPLPQTSTNTSAAGTPTAATPAGDAGSDQIQTSANTPQARQGDSSGQDTAMQAITPGQENLPQFASGTEAGKDAEQEYAQSELNKQLDDNDSTDDAQSNDSGDNASDQDGMAKELAADKKGARDQQSRGKRRVDKEALSGIREDLDKNGLMDDKIDESLAKLEKTNAINSAKAAQSAAATMGDLSSYLKGQKSGLKMVGGGIINVIAIIKDIADFFDEFIVGYIVGIICQGIIVLATGVQKPLFIGKVLVKYIVAEIAIMVIELIPFLDWLPTTVCLTGGLYAVSFTKRKILGHKAEQVDKMLADFTGGKNKKGKGKK